MKYQVILVALAASFLSSCSEEQKPLSVKKIEQTKPDFDPVKVYAYEIDETNSYLRWSLWDKNTKSLLTGDLAVQAGNVEASSTEVKYCDFTVDLEQLDYKGESDLLTLDMIKDSVSQHEFVNQCGQLLKFKSTVVNVNTVKGKKVSEIEGVISGNGREQKVKFKSFTYRVDPFTKTLNMSLNGVEKLTKDIIINPADTASASNVGLHLVNQINFTVHLIGNNL